MTKKYKYFISRNLAILWVKLVSAKIANSSRAQEGLTQPQLLLSQPWGFSIFHHNHKKPEMSWEFPRKWWERANPSRRPKDPGRTKAELLLGQKEQLGPPSSPFPPREAGPRPGAVPRSDSANCCSQHWPRALLETRQSFLHPANPATDCGLNGQLVWQPLA